MMMARYMTESIGSRKSADRFRAFTTLEQARKWANKEVRHGETSVVIYTICTNGRLTERETVERDV